MNNFEYKKDYQKSSSLTLIPLLILALLSWTLNERVTFSLTEDVRVYITLIVRVFCLGLFSVSVSLLIPSTYRILQLTITSLSYVVLVFLLTKFSPQSTSAPIVCVLAAISSSFGLLPNFNSSFSKDKSSLIESIVIACILPILIFSTLLISINIINNFIELYFTKELGNSPTSFVFVPLYICLQIFGHHYELNEIASIMYSKHYLSAFTNAVVLTALFSLPAIVFTRIFFSYKKTRLFVITLTCFCILCNSIGACLSISLLILLIIFPSSFFILLCTSSILFFISYNLNVAEIVSISNLYNFDTNLSLLNLDNEIFESRLLQSLALILPPFLFCILNFWKKDKEMQKKEREGINNIGYKVNNKSIDELQLLALIRSLGGLSNFEIIRVFDGKIFIKIVDLNAVSNSTLNLLIKRRLQFDRVKKIYVLDFATRANFFANRLKLLTTSEFNIHNNGVNLEDSLNLRSK